MEGDRVDTAEGQPQGVAGNAEPSLLDAVARRAASGDRDAWGEVWIELSPRIHAYLRLAGSSDPEGLTSDVFVALIRRDEELHGGWEGLRSLAFTMAHSRLVDDRRRSHVRRGTMAYSPETDPRTTPSAEASALATTGESEVMALLDLLTEAERAVLTLRYVADLDLAQTASVLGRSTTTVSRLQTRALGSLRLYLTPPRTGTDSMKGVP